MRKLMLVPALLVSVPAVAAEADQPIKTIVETRDLDLASAHGQRRLHYRVAAAINQVCQQMGRDARSTAEALACRQRARAAAEQDIQLAVSQARLRAARLADAGERKPAL